MDAWTGCFERLQKKWHCKNEDGWTKRLRLLVRQWNRQGERLRRGASGSVGHGEAV